MNIKHVNIFLIILLFFLIVLHYGDCIESHIKNKDNNPHTIPSINKTIKDVNYWFAFA